MTRRLKLLETQQSDRKMTLENTQQKLQELSRKASETSHHCQALEEKNKVLSCSVVELSNKVGQLQAREQELLTMLKLKDNDILEASNHITEFTCKFKTLENALRAAKMEESSIHREKRDFKLRLKELMLETSKLKGDLSEKTKENNEQREEIIRLKQENDYLNTELMLSAERASRKDQLLQSAKSKQLRTDTELSNLRQIYVKQQRDLQFLHFNLESSQDMKPKPEEEGHEVSRGMVLSDLESSSDRDTVCSETSERKPTWFVSAPSCSLTRTCQACRAESRWPAGTEVRQPASLDPFQEGPAHGARALHGEESKQSGSVHVQDTSGRPASQSEGPWKAEDREAAWATALPMHEHWLQLPPSSCGGGEPGPAGSWGRPGPGEPRSPAEALESGCGSRSSLRRVTPCLSVSDQEWMRIFKPVQGEGGVWCRAFSSSPQAARGIQSAKSKRLGILLSVPN
uniref:Coiled-coil domain containing 62 n=1 Tax=Varanus komodoensis TaxID=61221 RepID=A0A8D2LJN3_VARKO